MSENKLKPCPFCGLKAELREESDHHGKYFYLGCSDQKCIAYNIVYTLPENEKDNSIKVWNSRPEISRLQIKIMEWADVMAWYEDYHHGSIGEDCICVARDMRKEVEK